jgi:hypothetical protein
MLSLRTRSAIIAAAFAFHRRRRQLERIIANLRRQLARAEDDELAELLADLQGDWSAMYCRWRGIRD